MTTTTNTRQDTDNNDKNVKERWVWNDNKRSRRLENDSRFPDFPTKEGSSSSDRKRRRRNTTIVYSKWKYIILLVWIGRVKRGGANWRQYVLHNYNRRQHSLVHIEFGGRYVGGDGYYDATMVGGTDRLYCRLQYAATHEVPALEHWK